MRKKNNEMIRTPAQKKYRTETYLKGVSLSKPQKELLEEWVRQEVDGITHTPNLVSPRFRKKDCHDYSYESPKSFNARVLKDLHVKGILEKKYVKQYRIGGGDGWIKLTKEVQAQIALGTIDVNTAEINKPGRVYPTYLYVLSPKVKLTLEKVIKIKIDIT